MLISMYPYLRSNGNYDHDGSRNIFLEAHGIKASGYLNEDGTVIIYSGSEIYSKIKDIASDTSGEVRQEMLDKGIIEKQLVDYNLLKIMLQRCSKCYIQF